MFNKRKKTLTKLEFWEKYELFELFDDLEKAEKLLSEFDGGYSNQFFGAKEFHKALVCEIEDLKFQNVPDFSKIWQWFAPTTSWDDFVGMEGLKLGNQIFERVDRLKNAES